MEFSYGDWVYLSDDLSDSINLNPVYNSQLVREKAGKRLKVVARYDGLYYRRGRYANTPTPGYLISGIYVAAHEVTSCEDHRLLSKKASEAFSTGVTKLL
jgi:hypothetical protein